MGPSHQPNGTGIVTRGGSISKDSPLQHPQASSPIRSGHAAAEALSPSGMAEAGAAPTAESQDGWKTHTGDSGNARQGPGDEGTGRTAREQAGRCPALR